MSYHSEYMGLNHEYHKMSKRCIGKAPELNCGAVKVCRCELSMSWDGTKVWTTLSKNSSACEGELRQHASFFTFGASQCKLEDPLFTIYNSSEDLVLGHWVKMGSTYRFHERADGISTTR